MRLFAQHRPVLSGHGARQLVPENQRALSPEMRAQLQALRANVADLLGRKPESHWQKPVSRAPKSSS